MTPAPPFPSENRTTSSADGADDLHRGPHELTGWLDGLVPALTERWVEEIRERGQIGGNGFAELVERFATLLVRLLPMMLGPNRDQIEPLWVRTSELFGAVAAKRGLAAGEAIEELHILRELVIRDLYRSPPAGGTVRLSLREILRMNRALDRAVTHGSVGHTDALFFEFFEGEGATSILSGADGREVAEVHLAQIDAELREILEHAARVRKAPRR